MAVRGGYGMYFDRTLVGIALQNAFVNPPFVYNAVFTSAGSSVPTLGNPIGGAQRNNEVIVPGLNAMSTDFKIPTTHQWSIGVQRELPGSMMVEGSYMANLSRKLPSSNLNMNQIRPEILGPQASTQKDRPFPQFSNVTINNPTLGESNYHAAVVRFEKRFSRGLNVSSTYTFAKFLDNAGSGGSSLGDEVSPYSDYYNRRADYGPTENDVRHRFTWSSVYELPFGAKRALLSTSPLRYVLGDWSVGSVVTLQSGAPFTVTTQTNTTNAFSSGNLRADVIRNPNLPSGDRRLDRWFDTDAFRQPAAYRFGNEGVNIVRADGKAMFDFSILRNFVFSESKHLQFRAELFNAFNHPNFGLAGHTFGGPGFGIISSADPGRRVQLGLRMVF
jgi:hypothetical protein